MSQVRVVLVRHGETEWSRDGRHTGTTDIPLTREGRRNAKALGKILAGRSFLRVLSSPMQRAIDTAKLAGYGDNLQIREDCSEWNYGDYEGITTVQIRTELPEWSLWSDGCPGGEHAADVGRRVDRVIAEIRDAGGDVAVFAHGHVLRVLAARWVELPPAGGLAFALETASVSVLGYERETPVILRWNRTV
jgi:probable phosphoglycerate mutase